MDQFTVANRFQFKTLTFERDAHGLFTVHERSDLAQEILDRISTTYDELLHNLLLEKSHTTCSSAIVQVGGPRRRVYETFCSLINGSIFDSSSSRRTKGEDPKRYLVPLFYRMTPPIHDLQNYYTNLIPLHTILP
jgi:hypothetical protein